MLLGKALLVMIMVKPDGNATGYAETNNVIESMEGCRSVMKTIVKSKKGVYELSESSDRISFRERMSGLQADKRYTITCTEINE